MHPLEPVETFFILEDGLLFMRIIIKKYLSDNTCEINLLDAFEKKEIHVDQFDSVPVPKT
jgi:hypothetical protein